MCNTETGKQKVFKNKLGLIEIINFESNTKSCDVILSYQDQYYNKQRLIKHKLRGSIFSDNKEIFKMVIHEETSKKINKNNKK